jgi:hypothetical protein
VTPAALATLRGLAAEGSLPLRVSGRCMEPELSHGSLVGVGRPWLYLPGDVVAFVGGSGQVVVHRLIGYHTRGGRIRLWTQADAAAFPDAPVGLDRVIGRVSGRVGLRRRAWAARRFLRVATTRALGRA